MVRNNYHCGIEFGVNIRHSSINSGMVVVVSADDGESVCVSEGWTKHTDYTMLCPPCPFLQLYNNYTE